MSKIVPSTHKTPDKNVVLQAAEELFSKQKNITTKEIKESLRSNNYWIDQNDVSTWIKELAHEHNWDAKFNGTFNTYIKTVKGVVTSSKSSISKLAGIIIDLFKIHKSAINDKSKLVTDLGLSNLDIEELSLECELQFGNPIPDALKNGTVKEVQDAVTAKNTIHGGRVTIKIDPLMDFAGAGADNSVIKKLITDLKISEEDWILSLGSTKTRMIYPGVETRDHVRTAFARRIGKKIQETRSMRVKNIL